MDKQAVLEQHALEQLRRGDLRAAHQTLSTLLRYRPNDSQLRNRILQVEHLVKQREEAQARIQAEPLRYAHAYIQAGRLVEGLKLLRAALAKDPSNQRLRELALDVAARLRSQTDEPSKRPPTMAKPASSPADALVLPAPEPEPMLVEPEPMLPPAATPVPSAASLDLPVPDVADSASVDPVGRAVAPSVGRPRVTGIDTPGADSSSSSIGSASVPSQVPDAPPTRVRRTVPPPSFESGRPTSPPSFESVRSMSPPPRMPPPRRTGSEASARSIVERHSSIPSGEDARQDAVLRARREAEERARSGGHDPADPSRQEAIARARAKAEARARGLNEPSGSVPPPPRAASSDPLRMRSPTRSEPWTYDLSEDESEDMEQTEVGPPPAPQTAPVGPLTPPPSPLTPPPMVASAEPILAVEEATEELPLSSNYGDAAFESVDMPPSGRPMPAALAAEATTADLEFQQARTESLDEADEVEVDDQPTVALLEASEAIDAVRAGQAPSLSQDVPRLSDSQPLTPPSMPVSSAPVVPDAPLASPEIAMLQTLLDRVRARARVEAFDYGLEEQA